MHKDKVQRQVKQFLWGFSTMQQQFKTKLEILTMIYLKKTFTSSLKSKKGYFS